MCGNARHDTVAHLRQSAARPELGACRPRAPGRALFLLRACHRRSRTCSDRFGLPTAVHIAPGQRPSTPHSRHSSATSSTVVPTEARRRARAADERAAAATDALCTPAAGARAGSARWAAACSDQRASGRDARRPVSALTAQWCALGGSVPSSGQAYSKAASMIFSAGGSR